MADNTIIAFTANNGPMVAWFPDAGTTPIRGEKATTWEGGVRVPMLIRWPERIKPGKISNGIQTNEDLFVTLAAAAGIKDVAAQLKESHKVHIDGVNNLDHWTGDAPSKRNVVLYYNESGLTAIRIGNWKSHMKQRGGAPVNLDIDVKAFQIIPMFIWSPGIKFLGADVSSLVMPIYGKNSIAAELSTISQSSTIAEDAWGLQDSYVQPLWLTWRTAQWDFSMAYGFWAPTGSYDPVALDNTGAGFWSHVMRTSVAWSPDAQRQSLVNLSLAYEINSNKNGIDLTPGDHLTVDIGAKRVFNPNWEA